MPPAIKPFLSVDDQLELLKQRGMVVADEVIAKRCLRRVGYYRLSAYWYPFRQTPNGPHLPRAIPARLDDFIPGTEFQTVFDFYIFDKKLRAHLADGLERIEIAMRAFVSDLLGVRDPIAHRNPAELDGRFARVIDPRTGNTKHHKWLIKQDGHFRRSREDFAEHFRSRYQGLNPPIWVACEVWDWGMLSHFFAGMKQTDKDQIARNFGAVNGLQLETWLRAMNDVRNICAHHSRLWNRGLSVIPRLPRAGAMPEIDHLARDNQSLSRIYTVMVLMRIMLKHIHPTLSDWHRRIADHAMAGPTNILINEATAGFPIGWRAQPLWA